MRKGKWEEMKKYVTEDERFKKLDQDTYDAIGVMLNAEKKFEAMKNVDEEGDVNMCQALQEMMEEGKLLGELQKLKELVAKKLQKGLSTEAIADMLEESVEVIGKIVEEIQRE